MEQLERLEFRFDKQVEAHSKLFADVLKLVEDLKQVKMDINHINMRLNWLEDDAKKGEKTPD